jgi:hypothetical protein
MLTDWSKDMAFAFAIAALAVPYLKSCHVVGMIKPAIAYEGAAILAAAIVALASVRDGLGLIRKTRRRWLQLALLIAIIVAAGIVDAGILMTASSDYIAPTHIRWVDRSFDYFFDRNAFVHTCKDFGS